ncbi:MAG: hypothetical protein JJT87_00145 [Halomonas sp.]|nr:hypothetical protein [Halomonas sp.]
MQRQAKWVQVIGACLLAGWLAGCAGQSAPPQPSTPPVVPQAAQEQPSIVTGTITGTGTASATDWVPPLFISPEEEAAYYVSRLADKRFVSSYGGHDNPRVWYIAAERLGEIGLPAVHLLLARLNTQDEYELMLTLYALQLATQDPLLMARTRGEYIQLTAPLNSAMNAQNLRIAKQWHQQHAALLDSL